MKQTLINELEEGWAEQRPDLDASAVTTAVRLDLVSRRLNETAALSVARLGLEWWEFDVLSALRRSGEPYKLSASQLARASLLSTSAMTHRIDLLEKRGFIDRLPDPEDRRKTMIQLTADGRQMSDRATSVRFEAADSAMQSLSTRQRERLDRLLEKLLENDG